MSARALYSARSPGARHWAAKKGERFREDRPTEAAVRLIRRNVSAKNPRVASVISSDSERGVWIFSMRDDAGPLPSVEVRRLREEDA